MMIDRGERKHGWCEECERLHATTLIGDLRSDVYCDPECDDDPRPIEWLRRINRYLKTLPDAGQWNRD